MSEPKRRKVALSLSQKVGILQKLDKVVTATRVAQDYGISISAITYIKGQKSKILEAVSGTVDEVKKK